MMQPLSLAKYPYVHGNPVNATDPSGMLVREDITVAPSVQQELVKQQTPQYWEIFRKNKERLIAYSIVIAAAIYALRSLHGDPEEDTEDDGMPKIVWGDDLRETTTHTIEAQSRRGNGFQGGLPGLGSPVLLTIAFPKQRNRAGWRSIFLEWYEKEPQCRNKTGRPIGISCDEYPYNSTIPGGPIFYNLNLVSLKPVSAAEQNTQGQWLSSFYTKARVIPWHPQKGWFAVGASLEERDSYWIAREGGPKNYFAKT